MKLGSCLKFSQGKVEYTDGSQRCVGKQMMAVFNFTSALGYNCVTSLTISVKCLISTYAASRFVGTDSHKSCD